MVALPEYTRVAQAQINTTGIAIPAPNTAVWDQISAATYQMGTDIASKLAESKGAQDQMASGDQPVSAFGGMLARALPISSAYQKGADEQFAVTKSVALREQVSKLTTEYATNPEGFNKAYTDLKKTWLGDVRTDLIAPFAKLADEQQIRGSMQINANIQQRDQQQKLVDLTNNTDKLRSELYDGARSGKMSPQDRDDRMAEINALVKSGLELGQITPIQAKQVLDQVGMNLREAETLHAFSKNPSLGFIEGVKTGTIGTGMTPEERQRLGGKLTTEWNQIQHQANIASARQSAAIKTKADDDLLSRSTTGVAVVTEQEVRTKMFPNSPERAEEFINKQKLADQSFQFRGSIGLTSPAEDAAALEKLKPVPGSVGYADAYKVYAQSQQVVAQKWEQVRSDPSQYLIGQSPQLRDMIYSEDPVIRSQGYEVMGTLQTRMGISVGQQTLMPKAEAQALVADINTLAITDPEAAANKVAQLAERYGPQYPVVARQLARLEQPLAPTYQVVATLVGKDDMATRVDLVRALSLGDQALKDNLDKKNSTLRSSVDQKVQSALADFNNTAIAQGDPRLVKTMNDAATSLAYYYAAQPGRSADDAAKAAVSALTNKYDYVGTMRVPKGMGADVEAATKDVVKQITPTMLRPVPARPGETLTDEQRLDIQADQAKRGRWVTNEDGTGVVRLYPNGQPVMIRSDALPGVVPAPAPVSPPGKIDPAVEAKALAKKKPIGPGNPGNEVRTDVATETTANRPAPQYRRLEVLFRDAKKLAPVTMAPAPLFDGAINFGIAP